MSSLLIVAIVGAACDRKPALKGQTNTRLTFYGRAVDQDGLPLEGVRFEYRLEAYPTDWSFQTRGRDNDASTLTAISDRDGQFQFRVSGCKLIRMKADLPGYRHFFDEDASSSLALDNTIYHLISWSDLCYRSAAASPAVYVFVKDGTDRVSAQPCRGGENSGNGRYWVPNAPGWPRRPSLPDVKCGRNENTSASPVPVS